MTDISRRFFRAFTYFLGCFVFVASVSADEKSPGVLGEYLKVSERVQGEVVVVMPPNEINKYLAKVDAAAKANPEWFAEHSKKSQPGVPLVFDERLGLTKEEYDDYIKLWSERKFEVVKKVIIELKPGRKGLWKVSVSGPGLPIKLLSYDSTADTWKSPNGTLARIADIAAAESSILGKWEGKEWKVEKDNAFLKQKMNFAIGRLDKGNYGLIVYRYQEVGSAEQRRFDESLVIRFKPVLPAPKK